MRLFLHKLTHWEYWSFFPIYFPVIILWIYYSIKARSLFFFNAANPTIKNGGFMAESKKEIYDLIPPQHYPKTELIKRGTSISKIYEILSNSGIKFPLIAKPDIGLRGAAVKKIYSKEELSLYHSMADFDFLIQDLIPFSNEFGIFYVRHPKEKEGRITGIVAKEFLIVVGDGFASVEELIKRNPRFELQLKFLKKEYGNKLNDILEVGISRNLVPYGNHARGAKFIDASNLITENLTKTINDVCLQIPQFYFGRIDIMYQSLHELKAGKHFSIVELNGAGSEPTHIYDPKHSLFFAWKELIRHIRYMFEISVANHKNGVPYLSYQEGMREFRLHQKQCSKIYNF